MMSIIAWNGDFTELKRYFFGLKKKTINKAKTSPVSMLRMFPFIIPDIPKARNITRAIAYR